ncbi:S9 family peptidase [Ruicaihuangia caeni]|uniref:S9 family peptidase n=1 Tax=Ruicaihuangia caeni TaxID=3042517 RepID=A0AAW6T7U8_9MICO|nr:S9 family peptidase [Klugiella sp. YN-L-19]MDI2098428.1 S9 family peptidase [Klugiella sp. YN-L-19]
MSEPASLPYGSWPSPLSAAGIVAGGHPVSGGLLVGAGPDREVWWLESRPAEQGRLAVRAVALAEVGRDRADAGSADSTNAADDAGVRDVLPAPWSARSRVHEYGGGAWAVIAADHPSGPTLVFVEHSDQRVYRLDAGASEPVAITGSDVDERFGELTPADGAVLAVRERHAADGAVKRDIVSIALDGSRTASVVAGSDFLAYPRLSPDGTRLAWIAWDHPRMPWDGTELRLGTVVDGAVMEWTTIAGGPDESVLQPEWVGDETLVIVSDRSGWWNPAMIELGAVSPSSGRPDRPVVRPLLSDAAEYAAPLWQLGTRWYSPLPVSSRADGHDRDHDDDHDRDRDRDHGDAGAAPRLLTVSFDPQTGTDRLCVISTGPDAGSPRDLELPFTSITLADVQPQTGEALVIGGGWSAPSTLHLVDPADGRRRSIRSCDSSPPDTDYLPLAEPMRLGGVPCIVHRPRNPEAVGAPGELPPYIVTVHGGPTARSSMALSLVNAYFTSRGIGVLAVDYGGSSGYGRAWRDRLRGQWGVVDVADTASAARGLIDAGLADPARIAIRGGSAGGLTVLAALATTDVFACGVSYYGVTDLLALADETHDFESHYLDGLIGPLPSDEAVYRERSPLAMADRLRHPVLLLQGLDDPIVPPAQSERLRAALERNGVPHAYVGYPGESHGFRRAETLIHSVQAELSFYGQLFGFDTPDAPGVELWRPSSPAASHSST